MRRNRGKAELNKTELSSARLQSTPGATLHRLSSVSLQLKDLPHFLHLAPVFCHTESSSCDACLSFHSWHFFIVHFFITLIRSALNSTSPGTPVDLLCVCMCVQHVPSMFQAVSQTISQSVAFCRFLMLCLQHHHQKKISPLTIAWCVCRCSNQKFFLVFCSYFQFLFSIYCLYSIWLIHYNFLPPPLFSLMSEKRERK